MPQMEFNSLQNKPRITYRKKKTSTKTKNEQFSYDTNIL